MMPGARQFMEGGGASSARVWGVATDGVAYTALSHVHQNTRSARVEMSFYLMPGFVYRNDLVRRNLFGCTTRDTDGILTNYNDNPSSWSCQMYSAGGSVIFNNWVPWSDKIEHVMVADRSGTSLSFQADSRPGSAYVNRDMTLGRMGIFTQNNYGAGNGVSPMPNRVPRNVAIVSFKYWDGGVLCADLTPAIHDGEACFYDSVNDEYLKNMAGSGSFSAVEEP